MKDMYKVKWCVCGMPHTFHSQAELDNFFTCPGCGRQLLAIQMTWYPLMEDADGNPPKRQLPKRQKQLTLL